VLATQKAQSIVGYSNNRAENDFYPTPPRYTKDILEREQLYGLTWEPACGDGAIVKVLDNYVPAGQIRYSDIVDRHFRMSEICDFLLENRKVENIITNPPFTLINEFAYHAHKCANKKIIFLAELAFLETEARKELFEKHPLARVWVYSKRIRFDKNIVSEKTGGGMIAFAWFVWDKEYQGETVLRWI
jgi:hypothetical protein